MLQPSLIYTGLYDPLLRDGISASFYDLLTFAAHRGHIAKIISIMPETKMVRVIFKQIKEIYSENIISITDNSCVFLQESIEVLFEIMPYSHENLLMGCEPEIIKKYYNILTKIPNAVYFTTDADITCLLIHNIMKTKSFHYIHSPISFINVLKKNIQLRRLLKNKCIYTISHVARNLIRTEESLNLKIWPPYIDFDRIHLNVSNFCKKTIGYYSAGPLKGDRIVEHIAKLMPDFKFHVMGYNSTIPSNLENVVHIKTEIGPAKFYQDISILIVPSLVEEGYPRVIMEAFSNGIPVIANNIGGISEALQDAGIMIDIENTDLATAQMYVEKIKIVFENIKSYKKYSEQAHFRAEKYKKDIYTTNKKYLKDLQQESLKKCLLD